VVLPVFSKLVRAVFNKSLFLYMTKIASIRVAIPSKAVRRKVAAIPKPFKGLLSNGLGVLKSNLEVGAFIRSLDLTFALSARRDYRSLFFLVSNAASVVGFRQKGHFYRLSGKLSWKALSRKKERIDRTGKSSASNLFLNSTEGSVYIRNNTGCISLNLALFY
jgi:hypothetical protein